MIPFSHGPKHLSRYHQWTFTTNGSEIRMKVFQVQQIINRACDKKDIIFIGLKNNKKGFEAVKKPQVNSGIDFKTIGELRRFDEGVRNFTLYDNGNGKFGIVSHTVSDTDEVDYTVVYCGNNFVVGRHLISPSKILFSLSTLTLKKAHPISQHYAFTLQQHVKSGQDLTVFAIPQGAGGAADVGDEKKEELKNNSAAKPVISDKTDEKKEVDVQAPLIIIDKEYTLGKAEVWKCKDKNGKMCYVLVFGVLQSFQTNLIHVKGFKMPESWAPGAVLPNVDTSAKAPHYFGVKRLSTKEIDIIWFFPLMHKRVVKRENGVSIHIVAFVPRLDLDVHIDGDNTLRLLGYGLTWDHLNEPGLVKFGENCFVTEIKTPVLSLDAFNYDKYEVFMKKQEKEKKENEQQ